MKPFSLETVLKYRKQLEDAAVSKLATAQRKYATAKNHYNQLHKEISELYEVYKRTQIEGMHLDDLLRHQERLSWLESLLDQANEEVERCKKNVSAERTEVLHKTRDKKVLEQLKEKQNRKYRDYIEKKETQQIDEIAVLSHDRKKTSDSN